jgi:hypothetical protein
MRFVGLPLGKDLFDFGVRGEVAGIGFRKSLPDILYLDKGFDGLLDNPFGRAIQRSCDRIHAGLQLSRQPNSYFDGIAHWPPATGSGLEY